MDVTIITMDDVCWEGLIRRTTVSDERCIVCKAPYESFLDFRCSPPDEAFLDFRCSPPDMLGNTVTFLNLPCGHVDPNGGWEIAPDVLARLILVAENVKDL